MAFPDRIERTLHLAAPPARVWAALTTAEGLGTWFGNAATVDLRPGGVAELRWDDGGCERLRIEHVDEPATFAFSWGLGHLDALPDDDPRRTYVEFTLTPHGDGTTLTVVETGFAQLSDIEHRSAYDSHSEGWTRELGELVDYVGTS